MSYQEFFNKHGIEILSGQDASGADVLTLRKENLLQAFEILKNDKFLCFDMLLAVIGMDCGIHFEVLYDLFSSKNNKKIMLKVALTKEQPFVESLCGFYSSANWYERECFDLLGIEFLNHPKLERILLPKDWQGHPLRKDYKEEDERLSWNRR